MNFSNLILYIDRYLAEIFDHKTIGDFQNNPFVQICYIKSKGRFLSQSYSFYVIPPGSIATHILPSVHNLLASSLLVSKYLLQDTPNVKPFSDKELGFCSGFVDKNGDIILCSVTTNPEDAKWVACTLISQLKIFLDSEP